MRKIFLAIAICVIAINLSYAQDTITSSQAKEFAGEFKFVKGTAAEVSTTKSGITYINFDNKYPDNIFSAVIFKDFKDVFDLAAISKCKNIVVYGKIEIYKDKPQIVLKEASQIVFCE